MASQEKDEHKMQYLRAIFDVFPSPSFVVDSDVRISDFNSAADELLGSEAPSVLGLPGGDAFHCVQADQNGCGASELCKDCILRNSVIAATNGKSSCRARHRAHWRTAKGIVEMDLLVTASLLPYTEKPKALLVLEDLNEIRRLRRFKPKPRRKPEAI